MGPGADGRASPLIVSMVLAAASPTFAVVLPGGRAPGESKKVDKAYDCWVIFSTARSKASCTFPIVRWHLVGSVVVDASRTG